jgi:hypothetical protein
MSRKLVSGVWVVVCDWVDPATQERCKLGVEGDPAMFVDPMGRKGENKHFQCGRHHGIIPQKEKPEFQLPKDHKLNQEVLKPGTVMEGVQVEEVDDE